MLRPSASHPETSHCRGECAERTTKVASAGLLQIWGLHGNAAEKRVPKKGRPGGQPQAPVHELEPGTPSRRRQPRTREHGLGSPAKFRHLPPNSLRENLHNRVWAPPGTPLRLPHLSEGKWACPGSKSHPGLGSRCFWMSFSPDGGRFRA